MMAGNPNWWSNMNPPPPTPPAEPMFPYSQYVNVGPNSSLSLDYSLPDHHHLRTLDPTPQSSWSQFLLINGGGTTGLIPGDNSEDHTLVNTSLTQFQPNRKSESWEDQTSLEESNSYGRGDGHGELQQGNGSARASWSRAIPVSSLGSCLTTDHSSECNSTATGAVCKKPRVQPSTQPPLKVRKEKLGDRITAIHQLVSPFGKTDTASVLFEAIGYIRFLHSQIEALSSPYLGHASKNTRNNDQQYVEVEGGEKEKVRDLRSRGLCLLPVSCTQHVGSDNGADYWAPSNGF